MRSLGVVTLMLCVAGGMTNEFFNMSNPTQVVPSGEKFRDRADAEIYCARQGRELAYIETESALAELEMYINKFIEPNGERRKFWIDGRTEHYATVYEEDWPMTRLSTNPKQQYCMGIMNYDWSNPKIWKPNGIRCYAYYAFQTKEALCAERTYRNKLIIVDHENGALLDHSESGQLCYDMGKEMVLMDSRADYHKVLAELRRTGDIQFDMWASGIWDSDHSGNWKLATGDSDNNQDGEKRCARVSDVGPNAPYPRMMKLIPCGSKSAEKTMCYDTPKHEPRYSRMSGASKK